MKLNPQARRQARFLALQAIYQWQASQEHPKVIAEQLLKNQDLKKLDIDYFSAIIENVITMQEKLDCELAPLLSRSVQELDPVELAILRIGMYELTQRLEIPYRVVINEAVELAKTFGATDGHKFVNGVLDRAAQSIRKAEMKSDHE